MAMKTKSVTRPRMSGTANMARTVVVSPPAGQARRRSVSVRSVSVRGAPSSRVSRGKDREQGPEPGFVIFQGTLDPGEHPLLTDRQTHGDPLHGKAPPKPSGAW